MSLALSQVSVVMVTYGAWHWTERALSALLELTPALDEVIVVDNGSPDDTPDLLTERFPAVRLLRNATNLGFGHACNQGAEAATAPLVCFLNSDAIVEAGWLAPLTRAITARDDVAAAVPCVHELDDRVQCAGALVGRDGTVLEYGNGATAGDPAVAFPRAIDFGPAACMVIERATFLACGGFSADYAPAYYEDADLCMTLAARGLRTVYIPASHVHHARYGSGDAAEARALSERNRARFVQRWAGALTGHPATLDPPTTQRVLAARDASATGRVLVLASGAPAADSPEEEWLLALQSLLPWARVTLVVERSADASWLSRGVEVLERPVAEVLGSRRFHYDAVFAGALPSVPEALLDERQPQATRLGSSPAELELSLATAGLL